MRPGNTGLQSKMNELCGGAHLCGPPDKKAPVSGETGAGFAPGVGAVEGELMPAAPYEGYWGK